MLFRLFFSLFAFFLLFAPPILGQNIGAIISFDDEDQVKKEFEYHYSLGIRHFIVEDKISFETLFSIDSLGVDIWVKAPFNYKISDKIVRNNELFRKTITELIIHYRTSPSVKGFILLWGTQYSEQLESQIKTMLPRFREQTPQKFGIGMLQNQPIQTNVFDERFELLSHLQTVSTPLPQYSVIEQTHGLQIDLRLLQLSFGTLKENGILFLPSQSIYSQPEVSEFVRVKNKHPQLLVSTTPLETTQRHGNWVIVILIIVWLSYAIHYAFEPTYRKSIGRFFFNHSFFANDILNRHERIGFSSIIVLAQVVTLSGIMFETVYSYFFNEITRRILIENIELVRIFNLIPLGFFILGIISSLLIMGASIFWLRFGLPNIKFITQITPIYTWFYHAHFVAIPLVIVATMMNPPNLVLLLIGLFAWFMVNVGAFVMVCIDDAKQNISRKQFIYSRTLYPYIFLTSVILILMKYFGVFQTLIYAFSISA